MRWLNPVQSLTTYLFKINFNIIVSPTPTSPNLSLPFRYTKKQFKRISHRYMLAARPTHLTILDFATPIIYTEGSLSLYNFSQPPFTSSWVKIFSSKLWRSHTPPIYILPSRREIKFYTHTTAALDYGPDDRGPRVRFPAGGGNFSPHHRVQTGSGAHPPFYPIGTRDSFPAGKAAGGVKLTTHPHLLPRSKNAWSYTSTPPIRLLAFYFYLYL
jgi:hypothetical protein